MSKILLVYASKTGVTQDVAREMAQLLSIPKDIYNCRDELLDRGDLTQVNIKPRQLDWDAYDMIVIGTSMYIGSPLKEIKSFCKKYQEKLIQKKLIFFTCGIGTEPEDKAYLWKNLPKEVSQRVLLYHHLGGEIREDKLNGFMRFAFREYVKQNGTGPGLKHTLMKEFSTEIVKLMS